MRLSVTIEHGATEVMIEKRVEFDTVEVVDISGATVLDTSEQALLDHLLPMADAAVAVYTGRRSS